MKVAVIVDKEQVEGKQKQYLGKEETKVFEKSPYMVQNNAKSK